MHVYVHILRIYLQGKTPECNWPCCTECINCCPDVQQDSCELFLSLWAACPGLLLQHREQCIWCHEQLQGVSRLQQVQVCIRDQRDRAAHGSHGDGETAPLNEIWKCQREPAAAGENAVSEGHALLHQRCPLLVWTAQERRLQVSYDYKGNCFKDFLSPVACFYNSFRDR